MSRGAPGVCWWSPRTFTGPTRSARGLLAWLVQELGSAQVLLVGTYRTDMAADEPLPALLVELDRLAFSERIELAR